MRILIQRKELFNILNSHLFLGHCLNASLSKFVKKLQFFSGPILSGSRLQMSLGWIRYSADRQVLYKLKQKEDGPNTKKVWSSCKYFCKTSLQLLPMISSAMKNIVINQKGMQNRSVFTARAARFWTSLYRV